MKKITACLMLLAMPWPAASQNGPHRFEAEADPIAYALNGYSVHAVYVYQRLRTDLGIFGIRQPEGYSSNKGYIIQSAGVGLKLNYLLDHQERFFAGLGLGYCHNHITDRENGQEQRHRLFSMGLHAGYRWFMFGRGSRALQGLYLAPWASLDCNLPLNNVHFARKYTQARFSVFPTVHIGYRFR